MTATLPLLVLLAAPPPIDVGDRRQLFIDDRFIAAKDRVELRVNPPQKLGLLRDDRGEPLRGHIARVIDDGKTARLYLGHEDVREPVAIEVRNRHLGDQRTHRTLYAVTDR